MSGNARVSLGPIAWQEERGRARSRWAQDGRTLGGDSGTTLVHSASGARETALVVPSGAAATLRVYDARGRQVESRTLTAARSVRLPAYGVAVLTGR